MVAAAQSRLAQVSQNSLAGHITPMNAAYAFRFEHLRGALMAAGSGPAQAAEQARAILYGELLRQSSMVAYVSVFRVLAWICLALIPLMFVMKPAKPREGAPPVH